MTPSRGRKRVPGRQMVQNRTNGTFLCKKRTFFEGPSGPGFPGGPASTPLGSPRGREKSPRTAVLHGKARTNAVQTCVSHVNIRAKSPETRTKYGKRQCLYMFYAVFSCFILFLAAFVAYIAIYCHK